MDKFNKTFYEMTTNVRFFLSHDETEKDNRVFRSHFNFVSKLYNYAEVIFSLVNEFIKSDNKYTRMRYSIYHIK